MPAKKRARPYTGTMWKVTTNGRPAGRFTTKARADAYAKEMRARARAAGHKPTIRVTKV